MSEFKLDPEQIREVADMQQLNSALLKQIGEIKDVEIGTAPKDVVYEEDKLKLYRYRSSEKNISVHPEPFQNNNPAVLICYALVNRPTMLDLQPDRSMIRGLLDQGMDVFLIDWGYPDGADRFLDLDDYINRYMFNCVKKVREVRNESQVNLLGVCQGGTLSLCFTALYPQLVKNLITMVAPVDFQTPDDLLSCWLKDLDVASLVTASGNVSGEFLNAAFVTMMPFRLLSQKYMSLLDIAHDKSKLENFMRMEKWIFDSPEQPGALFKQFVSCMYQQNQLVKGSLIIADKAVKLGNIKQPVFNLYATEDHLVPPASSKCLQKYISSKDYRELAFNGGHIGIYVSNKAKQVPIEIAQWLKERA